jgi:NMD protein affecting ribosome stability and mRNA decay
VHAPAVAVGQESVLSNGFERLPMPRYDHEGGGERGIEQGAMSEGRVRFGVWLTTGHSGEQRRTHQQHVSVPMVRIGCVKCARAASDQVEDTGPAWSAHAM